MAELLGVVALAGMLAATAATFSLDWAARERGRGEAYKVLSFLQTARMQAVSRNGACLFVLDPAARTVRVVDPNDPANPADDVVLSETRLTEDVAFTAPVSGTPVTLAPGPGSTWFASFAPDGSVPVGAGYISMRSGTRYNRVTLFGAGGAKLERWNGASWVEGS